MVEAHEIVFANKFGTVIIFTNRYNMELSINIPPILVTKNVNH